MRILSSFFVFFFLVSTPSRAASFLDSVQRMNWGDLEVVWVKDQRLPRFTASIYFKDGAHNDPFPGLTQSVFNLLTAGTKSQNQAELLEFFEFYGAKLRNNVTHEYSILSLSGLTRDIDPLVGKLCEILNDSQFPTDEVQSYASRSKSGLKNLVTSHAGLADRVFRQVSLQNTPYSKPVDGSLKGFDSLTPDLLKARLAKLNASKKILYISGPNEIKNMQKALANCSWKNELEIPEVELAKPSAQSTLYLVAVPGANQAQIRIGRYLTESEVQSRYENFELLASFLGGSFTSKLVQELRVKRGLTYSAGAYAAMQRDYGRAGVSTFTKNETAVETISLIRDIFGDISSGNITPEEFKHQQGHAVGSHAFSFEEMSAFIGQLIQYNHQERPLSELASYPQRVGKLKSADLSWANRVAFPWERLTIVVVGDPSLEKSLSRIRPVTVLNYEDYL